MPNRVRARLLPFVVAGAVVVGITAAAAAPPSHAHPAPHHGQPKIGLCHTGDDGPVFIVVAAPAVPAHLAHGDTLGPCAVTPVASPGATAR